MVLQIQNHKEKSIQFINHNKINTWKQQGKDLIIYIYFFLFAQNNIIITNYEVLLNIICIINIIESYLQLSFNQSIRYLSQYFILQFQIILKQNKLTNNMSQQKKLVSFFKQFVEKAFLPHLKNNQSTLSQWQYFSNMISQEMIDYRQIQIYLEVLASSNSTKSIGSINPVKQDISPKKEQQRLKNNKGVITRKQQFLQSHPTSNLNSFNPLRTFGGQKARMNMFPIRYNFEQKQQSSTNQKGFEKSFHKKQQKQVKSTTTKILNNIQMVYKTFVDNQHRLQSLQSKQPQKKYF